MPFTSPDTATYRHDVSSRGTVLSTIDRRDLLERYLPASLPSQEESQARRRRHSQQQDAKKISRLGHKKRIRPAIRQTVYLIIYLLIQAFFGIYIRIRQIARALHHKLIAVRHYHHRTPAYIQRDLQGLQRLPRHLSVLVKFDALADDGLETLLDEVAELSAWTIAAGIPLLSVYERTGVLKSFMPAVQELTTRKLALYFGLPPHTPSLRVFAPNLPAVEPIVSQQPRPQVNGVSDNNETEQTIKPQHLDLLLLSATDGRDTLVDLTRTLAEMAQQQKLDPKHITIELIDAEISATTSIPPLSLSNTTTKPQSSPTANPTTPSADTADNPSPEIPSEPDLLILFSPTVKLDGYPPWQLRLTEIFCVNDGDSGGGGDISGRGRTRVEYQGFLRGLWKFAGAEFRVGR